MNSMLNPDSYLGFLPYGFIGLGAISLLVFLAIAVTTKSNRFSLSLAAGLSATVLLSGLYLQANSSSQSEFTNLPPFQCTTEGGTLGRVEITTGIFNEDGTYHNFEQVHSPEPGKWTLSNNNVADVLENTSSYPSKKWGVAWQCR